MIQKLSGLLSLCVVIAAWVLFAPAQVGGAASYVIINGNSMEPVYFRDDLVILRTAQTYQIGDIVTYQHPTIGQIIHRIIDKQGDHFIFKGDNNGFIDSYQPVQSELIGRAWIHLSGAGTMVKQIRQPWVVALLAGLISLVVVAPSAGKLASTKKAQRRKKGQHQQAHQSVSPALVKSEDVMLVLVVVIGLALVLGIFSFTRPVTKSITESVAYSHEGRFSYTAPAPPGLYSNDTVQAGEPIFRKLISQVDFTFAYRLAADKAENMTGSGQMQALVSANNGWQWTFDLQPEMAFSGNQVDLRGVLNLSEIQTMVESIQQQTGVRFQSYTLTIIPTVNVAGRVDGEPLDDQFAPQLVFLLDDLQMQLAERPSANGADPLSFSQSGALPRTLMASNPLSLLGISLAVTTARTLAIAGLIIGVAGLAITALFFMMTGSQDESTRIQARYGPLMVGVQRSTLDEEKRVAAVASIDDLVKVAERSGSMILHEANGPLHTYYVQMDQVVYRYQSRDRDRDRDGDRELVELRREREDNAS